MKRTLTAAEIKSAILRSNNRQGLVFSKDSPFWLRKRALDAIKRDVEAYKEAYTLTPRTTTALNDWVANLGAKWVW